jgi:hypothetical protein
VVVVGGVTTIEDGEEAIIKMMGKTLAMAVATEPVDVAQELIVLIFNISGCFEEGPDARCRESQLWPLANSYEVHDLSTRYPWTKAVAC